MASSRSSKNLPITPATATPRTRFESSDIEGMTPVATPGVHVVVSYGENLQMPQQRLSESASVLSLGGGAAGAQAAVTYGEMTAAQQTSYGIGGGNDYIFENHQQPETLAVSEAREDVLILQEAAKYDETAKRKIGYTMGLAIPAMVWMLVFFIYWAVHLSTSANVASQIGNFIDSKSREADLEPFSSASANGIQMVPIVILGVFSAVMLAGLVVLILAGLNNGAQAIVEKNTTRDGKLKIGARHLTEESKNLKDTEQYRYATHSFLINSYVEDGKKRQTKLEEVLNKRVRSAKIGAILIGFGATLLAFASLGLALSLFTMADRVYKTRYAAFDYTTPEHAAEFTAWLQAGGVTRVMQGNGHADVNIVIANGEPSKLIAAGVLLIVFSFVLPIWSVFIAVQSGEAINSYAERVREFYTVDEESRDMVIGSKKNAVVATKQAALASLVIPETVGYEVTVNRQSVKGNSYGFVAGHSPANQTFGA